MSEKKCLIRNDGKLILVLSSSELEQLRIDAHGDNEARNLLISSEIKDLSDSILRKLDDSGILNHGSILIQSLFDRSVYVPLNNATYSFISDKCMYFSSVCGRLGAKTVYTKRVEIKNRDNELIFGVDVDINNLANVNANVAKNTKHKDINSIILKRKFPKCNPDCNLATQLLLDYRLTGDSYLTSLVRDTKDGYRGTEFSYVISTSQELEASVKVALSLNIPSLLKSLNTNLKNVDKESYSYTLLIQVEFWE